MFARSSLEPQITCVWKCALLRRRFSYLGAVPNPGKPCIRSVHLEGPMSLTSFSSRHLPSRRNFLHTTAATLAASAMATGLAPHAVAENENENEKRKQADPKPIPGGTPRS